MKPKSNYDGDEQFTFQSVKNVLDPMLKEIFAERDKIFRAKIQEILDNPDFYDKKDDPPKGTN